MCFAYPRLGEVLELLRGDARVGDHGPPELPHQTQCDLVGWALAQEGPAAVLPGNVCGIPESKPVGRLGRPLTVEEMARELGQYPHRTQQPDQRLAAPDREEIHLHQRFPGGLEAGPNQGPDRVRQVVHGKELVGDCLLGRHQLTAITMIAR